ncbi:MAG: putative basic amino acid antiporter YfcC [Candidatus Aminicenantes bacterium]|nr:putative basic amino acid antiporter YfcC [Candidatus Aminicenantes bacterium]
MIIAALSTWLIPSGEYIRIEQQERVIIDPGSYHTVKAAPAGPGDIFLAFPKGLKEVADIVFFIFIIGGAFGVLNATGTIETGINSLTRRIGKRRALIVPLLTLLFAIGGGSIGIAEETLIFLPALLLLSRSLGYDSLVAGGIALVGANAGFASAFMNPFTVGVAQGIVGLPLFSGIGFRLVLWSVITSVTILYLTRYAAKVRAKPSISLMYESDQQRQFNEEQKTEDRLTKKQLTVLLVSILALALLATGAICWKWGIIELSSLFFGLSIIVGPLGGLSLDKTANSFIKGASDITYAALVVGLARGTFVILRDACVIDTITHTITAVIQKLPSSINVLGIYAMQNGLNFIVPSGSGQAAVSMPVLAPLGDLLGITRQTNVLAYQLGNGFTNIFAPTMGYFMAALGILKIPWATWIRWLYPLLLIWLGIGSVAVLIAHLIRLGPF